jgi:hypothetical protein
MEEEEAQVIREGVDLEGWEAIRINDRLYLSKLLMFLIKPYFAKIKFFQ